MNYSLYFHIPFCSHRCAYCDFNTYAGQEGSIPAYVDALCKEVELVGRKFPGDNKVHTIFFGGGTPSLLSPRTPSAHRAGAGTSRAMIDRHQETSSPTRVGLDDLNSETAEQSFATACP